MTQINSPAGFAIEGPEIHTLHHRLTSAPNWINDTKDLLALVHDFIYKRAPEFSHEVLAVFRVGNEHARWAPLTILTLYFLDAEAFTPYQWNAQQLATTLTKKAQELGSAGKANIYINDVDRREEFIRVVLHALNMRPQGESEMQAEDRLQAASSSERLKVIEAARASEERAKAVRKAMAEQRAREAADKMSRE